ncbi:MAG: hypothetical protein ACRBN8_46070 [Nannocystales bacterium]
MLLHNLLATSIVAAAPAEDPEALFPNTRLEIDASAISEQSSTEDASLWEDIIATRLGEEFRAYHIPLITMGEAATFKATISWAGGDDSTDIRIEVEISKADAPAETRSFICKDCEFAPGAAERIIEEMPTLVPLLEQPAPKKEAPPPPVDQTPTTEDQPRKKALSAVGWSGVAIGVVGVGLVGGGAFFLTREETNAAPDTQGRRSGTDTHPMRTPGIVLTAAGGAALAAGLTMVIVDARRQKKRDSKPSVTLGPTFGTTGIVLTGTF